MIRPQPRCFHRRHDRAGAVERGGQVRVDHRVPVVIGHLLQRVADLADDPAGGVDQDVHRADGVKETAAHGGLGGSGRRCPCRRRGPSRRRAQSASAIAVPIPWAAAGDDRHPACQSLLVRLIRSAPSWSSRLASVAPRPRPATPGTSARGPGRRSRGVPSILAIRASTAAAPSSASGMQTLVTGTSRKARHSSSSKLTTETSPGTATCASRSAASTPNSWSMLPTPQAVGSGPAAAGAWSLSQPPSSVAGACRIVTARPSAAQCRRAAVDPAVHGVDVASARRSAPRCGGRGRPRGRGTAGRRPPRP